jgi:hypothetical protein
MRLALLALVLFASSAIAAPTTLTSTVTRVPMEPAIVIVPANAGKTVLERYRSKAKAISDTPLVVIVRLPDANTPDTFGVTNARRDGTKISATIESRRSTGAVAANEVTMPLVEIALGDLPTGTYTIDIDERLFRDNGKPTRGLSSSITLTVQ